VTLAERFAQLGACSRAWPRVGSLPLTEERPAQARSRTVYSVAEAVRLQEHKNAKLGASPNGDPSRAR
jgi:hypothetical protein